MSLYDDPVAVIELMVTMSLNQKLDTAKFASGGHGAAAAKSRLRRYTHDMSVLGRHFRDLTLRTGQAKTDRIQKFIAKWEKRTRNGDGSPT